MLLTWRNFMRLPWSDQRVILVTGLCPSVTRKGNIHLWIRILFMSVSLGLLSWPITPLISAHMTGLDRYLYLILYNIGIGVTIIYGCVFRQLNTVMSARIESRYQDLLAQASQQEHEHTQKLIDDLRINSNRSYLPNNPVSLVAASIDVIQQSKSREALYRTNPLRAALDGALRPEYFFPHEDPPENTL